eukprot:2574043-Rhodomonas_salina.2
MPEPNRHLVLCVDTPLASWQAAALVVLKRLEEALMLRLCPVARPLESVRADSFVRRRLASNRRVADSVLDA